MCLQVLRRSEAVCLEIGYECALQYLAQHLIVLGVPIVVTTEKALSVPRKLKRKRMDGFEEVRVRVPLCVCGCVPCVAFCASLKCVQAPWYIHC